MITESKRHGEKPKRAWRRRRHESVGISRLDYDNSHDDWENDSSAVVVQSIKNQQNDNDADLWSSSSSSSCALFGTYQEQQVQQSYCELLLLLLSLSCLQEQDQDQQERMIRQQRRRRRQRQQQPRVTGRVDEFRITWIVIFLFLSLFDHGSCQHAPLRNNHNQQQQQQQQQRQREQQQQQQRQDKTIDQANEGEYVNNINNGNIESIPASRRQRPPQITREQQWSSSSSSSFDDRDDKRKNISSNGKHRVGVEMNAYKNNNSNILLHNNQTNTTKPINGGGGGGRPIGGRKMSSTTAPVTTPTTTTSTKTTVEGTAETTQDQATPVSTPSSTTASSTTSRTLEQKRDKTTWTTTTTTTASSSSLNSDQYPVNDVADDTTSTTTAGPNDKKKGHSNHDDQTEKYKVFWTWCRQVLGIETLLEIQTFEYSDYMKALPSEDWHDDLDAVVANVDQFPKLSVRGLAASRDITNGEVVIRIPLQALLSVTTTIDQDPILSTIMGPEVRKQRGWNVGSGENSGTTTTTGTKTTESSSSSSLFWVELPLLALALLHHLKLGMASPLHPYLEVLQGQPIDRFPFLWSEEQLRSQVSEGIRNVARGVQHELLNMYETIAIPLIAENPHVFGRSNRNGGTKTTDRNTSKENGGKDSGNNNNSNNNNNGFNSDDNHDDGPFSFAKFQWAFAMVNTRHWQLPIEDLEYNDDDDRNDDNKPMYGDNLPPASMPTDEWTAQQQDNQQELDDTSTRSPSIDTDASYQQDIGNEDLNNQNSKGAPPLDSDGSNPSSMAHYRHSFLAPVADLLNFGPPCTKGHYNRNLHSFEIVASCDLKKGQEVTFWYSDECDHVMVAVYGFMHPMVPACPSAEEYRLSSLEWQDRAMHLQTKIATIHEQMQKYDETLQQLRTIIQTCGENCCAKYYHQLLLENEEEDEGNGNDLIRQLLYGTDDDDVDDNDDDHLDNVPMHNVRGGSTGTGGSSGLLWSSHSSSNNNNNHNNNNNNGGQRQNHFRSHHTNARQNDQDMDHHHRHKGKENHHGKHLSSLQQQHKTTIVQHGGGGTRRRQHLLQQQKQQKHHWYDTGRSRTSLSGDPEEHDL